METTAIETKTYQAGDIIFKEQDIEECMYDILQGKVGIYAGYGTEQQKLLTELTDGELFGEMGMLECFPRSATAVALTDTSLRQVTWDNFEAYFTASPDRVYTVMTQMSRRLRSLSNDYVDVCRAAAEITVWEKKTPGEWLKNCLAKCKDMTKLVDHAAASGSLTPLEMSLYINNLYF